MRNDERAANVAMADSATWFRGDPARLSDEDLKKLASSGAMQRSTRRRVSLLRRFINWFKGGRYGR